MMIAPLRRGFLRRSDPPVIGTCSARTPRPRVADPKPREVTIGMKAYNYAYDPGHITVYEGQ
jgi:hypothetical protein